MSINHGHVASRGWWESLDSYGRLWIFQWWDWGWWSEPSIKHFGFRVWVHHFVMTKQRLHSEIRGIVSFIVFLSLLLPCHTEFLFAELFLISNAPTSSILWRNCRLSIPSDLIIATFSEMDLHDCTQYMQDVSVLDTVSNKCILHSCMQQPPRNRMIGWYWNYILKLDQFKCSTLIMPYVKGPYDLIGSFVCTSPFSILVGGGRETLAGVFLRSLMGVGERLEKRNE